jgi:hypothetical protein
MTFQTAEMAAPRELFAAILERIQRFGVPPPLERPGRTLRLDNGPDDSCQATVRAARHEG